MNVKILWLSPEQPPLTPDSDDAERAADIQQKQLSLIRRYQKEIAEKDKDIERVREHGHGLRLRMQELYEEIATLKAGLEQRHALLERKDAEIQTLKNLLRTKGEELSAKTQAQTAEPACNAGETLLNETQALRDILAALKKERDALKDKAARWWEIPTPGRKITQLTALLRDLSKQPKESRTDDDWLTERDILDVISLTQRWISKEAGFNAVTCILTRMKDDDQRDAWRTAGTWLHLDR